jgi:hypothetical protein
LVGTCDFVGDLTAEASSLWSHLGNERGVLRRLCGLAHSLRGYEKGHREREGKETQVAININTYPRLRCDMTMRSTVIGEVRHSSHPSHQVESGYPADQANPIVSSLLHLQDGYSEIGVRLNRGYEE